MRLRNLLAVSFGLLLGSIPVGLLVGKATRGIDVREGGSGSTGATNVFRHLGLGAGVLTFAADLLKGTGAVALARRLGCGRGGQAGAALAAVVGHSYPVFANFRGGKSAATAMGGLLLISPRASRWAVAGGVGSLLLTRTVSVASLLAAAASTVGAAAELADDGDNVSLWYTGAAGAFIALRHRENIVRLARGEEPKVDLRPERRSTPVQ